MFVKVTVAYDFRITKKYLLSLDPYFVVNNSYCRTYSREEQFLKQAYLLLLLEDTTSQISSLVQIYIVFSIYFICITVLNGLCLFGPNRFMTMGF